MDVRLAGPLSVEFNLMWRNVGFDLSRELPGNRFRSTTRILDLPVLARLTAFRGSATRPFVSGGYLRRYASNTISGDFMSARTRIGWSHGWAAGAGVSFGTGFLRIEPEYRYSNAWT